MFVSRPILTWHLCTPTGGSSSLLRLRTTKVSNRPATATPSADEACATSSPLPHEPSGEVMLISAHTRAGHFAGPRIQSRCASRPPELCRSHNERRVSPAAATPNLGAGWIGRWQLPTADARRAANTLRTAAARRVPGDAGTDRPGTGAAGRHGGTRETGRRTDGRGDKEPQETEDRGGHEREDGEDGREDLGRTEKLGICAHHLLFVRCVGGNESRLKSI